MAREMNRRKFLHTTSLAAVAAASTKGLGASFNVGRPIRVAQIGTRHAHARSKWKTICEMPDRFVPIGIFEPDPERRQEVAEDSDYAEARWIDQRDELLDLEVDAVLVETELPGLVQWAQFGLESGWHVHVDKPPGKDRDGLARLQNLAEQGNRVLQMGYMYRYHPAFSFCLEAVRKGWIGRLYAVHGEIGKVVGSDRRPWLAEVYGGSMMLLGCHLLDLVLAVLGKPDRVEAFRRQTYPDQDAYFDHELAVLEYPGALATVRSMLAEVGGGDRRQLVLCGENGTIEVRPLEPARVRLALLEPTGPFKSGEQVVAIQPVQGRYAEQLIDFHSMIGGNPSSVPEFTTEHDRLLQDVLILASAADSESSENIQDSI
jgi:predicted dehydrogenase